MTATRHESTAKHPAPLRHAASPWRMIFILAGAPIAWLSQLIVAYMLATHACYPHVAPEIVPTNRFLSPILAIIMGLAVVASCGALWGSWRLWQETRTEAKGKRRQALTFGEGRMRFMAMVGTIVSSLFAVACLFAWIAYILVSPCG